MAPPATSRHNDGPSFKVQFPPLSSFSTEALPIINKFQLSGAVDSVFPKQVPWVRYHGTYKDLYINIILPRKDVVLGVDNVGTVSASLVTYASIQTLQPDLIISAGTAGGFKAKGASIGDVFLVSDVSFHDRRIPIPVFDLYGVGLQQALSAPNISKHINLKGAAVAYVADLLKVPAIFMIAVTDVVDVDKPTSVEYLQNLPAVTAALGQAVTHVIHYINGKCISEL